MLVTKKIRARSRKKTTKKQTKENIQLCVYGRGGWWCMILRRLMR